jgi:hypothetical protein
MTRDERVGRAVIIAFAIAEALAIAVFISGQVHLFR